MPKGLIYNSTTGEVVRVVSATSIALLQIQTDGDPLLEVFVDLSENLSQDYYIDVNQNPEVAVLKQTLGANFDKIEIDADGIDKATLSGLPIPCVILRDYTPFIIPSNPVEFTCDSIGEYKIIFQHPQYFDKEWKINGI